jgi:hypothetical protein
MRCALIDIKEVENPMGGGARDDVINHLNHKKIRFIINETDFLSMFYANF